MRFYGDAPEFGTDWANEVKATVYYPAENDTWTEDVRKDYGGTLTWVEWTPGKAAAQLRGVHTGGHDGDGLRFTGLIAGAPYVLLVARDRGRGLLDSGNLLYIAQGTAEADGTLRFPVRWAETGAFAGLFGQGGGTLAALACDGTGCPGSGFADMPRPGNWAHAGIDFALSNGLFNGTSATTFAPSGDMTRAMLVTVLWRLDGTPAPAGENGFSDVPAGKWYTKAVTWAAENGVVNGVGSGRFDPEGRVTREQIAAILFRYAQKKGCDTAARAELAAFPDGGDVSRYAREALSWANAAGLVNGTNTPQGVRLDPKGNATRAQVATILMRYVRNVVRG